MAFSLIFLLSKEGNPNLQSVAVAKEKHAILTKTSSTQAAKSHAGKAEAYCFAHPAQGSTNIHPHLYHREGIETRENKEKR